MFQESANGFDANTETYSLNFVFKHTGCSGCRFKKALNKNITQKRNIKPCSVCLRGDKRQPFGTVLRKRGTYKQSETVTSKKKK